MKKTLTILLVAYVAFSVKAQELSPEIITSSGGNYTNQYASMTVTIGEPVIETISNSDATLTQGFQQCEIQINAIDKISNLDCNINIFPNPTANIVNIELDKTLEKISLQICDAGGKILINQKIENESKMYINMQNQVPGIYYLKISTGNKANNYKIVKR